MNNTTAPEASTQELALPRPRFPWMAWAILLFAASWAIGGLGMLFRVKDDSLTGLLMLLSLPLAVYAAVDRFGISRGRPVRKTPWLGRISFALVAIAVLSVWLSIFRSAAPSPQSESAKDSNDGVTAEAQEGVFISAVGKPYRLWLPTGWKRLEAGPVESDVAVGNNNDSVAVALTAVPVVDVPPPMRSPESVVKAWREGILAKSEDCEDLEPLQCTLLDQATSMHRLDATVHGPDGVGRYRFAIAVVSDGDHLCRVTLLSLPSFAEKEGVDACREVATWCQRTE